MAVMGWGSIGSDLETFWILVGKFWVGGGEEGFDVEGKGGGVMLKLRSEVRIWNEKGGLFGCFGVAMGEEEEEGGVVEGVVEHCCCYV